MNYKDPDMTSEDETAKKRANVKPKPKPGAIAPSEEWISSQNNKMVHPAQRLLPIKSDTPVTSSLDKDNSDADTELYEPELEEENTDTPKGAFPITVKSLKKAKKYNCK